MPRKNLGKKLDVNGTLQDLGNTLSDEDLEKFDGIEEGAQKNVQADWEATEGDSFIKNKPNVVTTSTSQTLYRKNFNQVTINAGTSSTASSTAIKVVTLSNFELKTGAIIDVKFSNASYYDTGTTTGLELSLNVNSTGAKKIINYISSGGTNILHSKNNYRKWNSGDTVRFRYDGTYWTLVANLTTMTSYLAPVFRFPLKYNKSDGSSTYWYGTENLDLTHLLPSTVQYVSQSLTDAQKTQARTNIGAGTSNFSGSYNDLSNKPTLFSGNYNDLTNKPTIPDTSKFATTSQLNAKLTGTKYSTNSPDKYCGYNAEENPNSEYQMAFKNNNDLYGFCWSRLGNMTTTSKSPSQCTFNGFFYVSSTTNSLSGADANPFLQYHTSQADFRILTTAYSDIWLQQIATDFRSPHVYVRRKENGTWSAWVKLASTSDLSSYVPTSRTVNGKSLSSNISLGNKDVGSLPDYTLTINHGTAGNPRMVKFASVNYSSAATCFKMGAMTCHDNGVSYQFLTDMLIAVTTAGEVTANIYKFAQSSIGNVDGVTRYTGDVFYVNDTTNKIVDFYILCGQYSSSQFTPATKVGSTTIANVTQYSGNATYYSSGTKTWVNGCGGTYARTTELGTQATFSLSGTTLTITPK